MVMNTQHRLDEIRLLFSPLNSLLVSRLCVTPCSARTVYSFSYPPVVVNPVCLEF